MPNRPMTAMMKSKPFISSVTPKVMRSWPVTMSRPTAARMKPKRIETSDLSGLPPPRPTNEENVRSWMAKNSGGPNFSAISASSGREQRDQHDGEERAHERGGEGGREGLPAQALPGQRIAVEGGGHRPRLARDVEQDGGDRAAEESAPVERGQQDDRGGRRHRERERQQDGHTVGAAQSGQHADDRAQQDARDRHEQIERGDGDREAQEEVLEAHAQNPSQASSGPFGIGTRNHRSKTMNVTRGIPMPRATVVTQACRPTHRM